jgi:opacity protein-like surface antigen
MTPFWSSELGRCPVNFTVRPWIVAFGVLALCGPVDAQVAPPEAARGLFGNGARATAKTQLDLNVTLNEGYDSDELRGVVSTTNPTNLATPTTFEGGGFSTLLRTGATYTHRGKAEFAARANSVMRYYSDIGELRSVGHNAGIGLTTTTVGGLTLLLNQSAAYSPASFYGLFENGTPLEAGDPGITTPNYTVGNNNFQTYTYTTSMLLKHDIGPRSYASVTGEFFYTDRVHETPTWNDISSYSLGGQYSRNTTRNIALTTEFRYRSGEFGYSGGGKATELALDVGVDYRRPVSATRRVTLGAHIGLSGAEYPGTEIGLIGFRRQGRVVGDGAFSIPLSHTWFATTSIRRGLEYETTFPAPVVNNAAKFSVTGLVTSRVDVVLSAGYARGESIFNQETFSFDTYTGEVGVRYAVSRNLAFNGGYLYYNYNTHNVLLLPGLPPGLKRNGVRAGLTLWTPALRR